MKKGIVIGIIVAVLAIIGVLLIIIKPFGKQESSISYSRNQEAKIKEENISIKVNSVEQVRKQHLIGNETKNYIKVNVTVTNNSSKNTTVPVLNFNIVDNNGQEYSEDSVWIEDDNKFSSDISAGSSTRGNLFFEANLKNGMELQYCTIENAHMSSDGKLQGNYKYYNIKLD